MWPVGGGRVRLSNLSGTSRFFVPFIGDHYFFHWHATWACAESLIPRTSGPAMAARPTISSKPSDFGTLSA